MNIPNFVVIDFETSGLKPSEGARVIEIGAVRVVDGEVTSIFNTMVQQDPALVTPEITKLTGHTQEDVAKGMPEDLAFPILYNFLSGADVVVAYNALFDLWFLADGMNRHWVDIAQGMPYTASYDEYPVPDFICPLTIARDNYKYPHKLSDMCARFDIPLEAHSAYHDAMGTAELLLKFYKLGLVKPEYKNLYGHKFKYGEPDWVPAHATIKDADKTKTVWRDSKGDVLPGQAGVVPRVPKKTPQSNLRKAGQ